MLQNFLFKLLFNPILGGCDHGCCCKQDLLLPLVLAAAAGLAGFVFGQNFNNNNNNGRMFPQSDNELSAQQILEGSLWILFKIII